MVTDRLIGKFRISRAMGPYVLRIRLRGSDFEFGATPERAAAFTRCMGEMKRILLEKGRVPAIAADRAILKTLEVAFDFQLADLRYRSLKTMEARSHAALDDLIQGLRQLSNAIAQLPPTSKGQLNKRVFAKINQAPFDSEVFIEIIEAIERALPEIGPRRLADNIFSLVHPQLCGAGRSPIIDQWEAMPAVTRVKVEAKVAIPARSLVRWLDSLADLLERERPARKRGAPHSVAQVFASRIAAIWRSLGLKPGLAYNFNLHPGTADRIGRGGRVESRFQRYCRAALTAVGDARKISARQVANYKRNSKGQQRL
jgi:hypothetical protein